MRVALLSLLPVAIAAPYTPTPFPAVTSTSPYCNLTSSVTYWDQYSPVLSEYSYTCSLPPLSPASPPPYLSPPSISSHPSHPSLQKPTIHSPACITLPHASRLSDSRYSNLFWGLRSLTNQSCIDPGQVKEYADIERGWSADWRFTVVNRGAKRRCEWYQELGNLAEAMHYYCFFNGPASVGEHSGGEEALVWGMENPEEDVGKGGKREGTQEGGLRWCFRYSSRGWGEKLWEEKCLGVVGGDEKESSETGEGGELEAEIGEL